MDPETAVANLAEILAARDKFTELEIYEAMEEQGFPEPVAIHAYKFTQTAWARAVLYSMGVRFDNEYIWFDADGEAVRAGLIEEEPYYLAAVGLVEKYAHKPAFSLLVQMSAEANTVDAALQDGSEAENLVLGPAAFFMEAATEEGIAKARKYLTDPR
ncbi:hypothetical protein [Lignipirellula cremea]|uniref:Uncharacterized protein n=1 Tax=Lignipirellula cremea TaxID=2528010 RepID=A0A518DUV1_9BACT|nr:hypothetical protein [Lignipirellula cremea]QDU95616.1 hypothetical protein Pla8534_34320 [Lignipirellula cremea]